MPPELHDFQKNFRFLAQNASRVRILSEKRLFFPIISQNPHKIRTLLNFCTENDGIFQKWRF